MEKGLHTREEIREGCKNCKFCEKESWEQKKLCWCFYGSKRSYRLTKGTDNCVFWNKTAK